MYECIYLQLILLELLNKPEVGGVKQLHQFHALLCTFHFAVPLCEQCVLWIMWLLAVLSYKHMGGKRKMYLYTFLHFVTSRTLPANTMEHLILYPVSQYSHCSEFGTLRRCLKLLGLFLD